MPRTVSEYLFILALGVGGATFAVDQVSAQLTTLSNSVSQTISNVPVGGN